MIKKYYKHVKLIILVGILLVSSVIALPKLTESATISKINTCKINVMTLNFQAIMYYQNEKEWSNSLTDLDDPNHFPDGRPKCPFGNPYTLHDSKRWINQHNH
ncbi:MAG: hypothetical protein GY774_39395 [Planctomycetes bacterium]|nr:hypothetical protein [Planctomycetota bacterium]